ncbi:MAG TPA: CoA-transferase [Methylocella sp.]|nr:CoA-transferase [Methylocella sp.]
MQSCTFGEMMIAALARTIEDGTLVFHGFGSPLVQLAMHVAKRTHAPHMVLVAGATYGVDPEPLFLAPTSNDWVMDRGASCALGIEELFGLAAAGRMGRMFLSGLQIDRWGNCNVTVLGRPDIKLKLPGGGGGCNLSCDAAELTLWTTAHRAPRDAAGRPRFRLVKDCDFITSLGHRTKDGRRRHDLGHQGSGPQWLVTELGLLTSTRMVTCGSRLFIPTHPWTMSWRTRNLNRNFQPGSKRFLRQTRKPSRSSGGWTRLKSMKRKSAPRTESADSKSHRREGQMPMTASDRLADRAAQCPHPLFKNRLNFVPLPYRSVSVQPYHGPMTEDGIVNAFLGREAYRRTEFIILKADDGGMPSSQ